jgi:hypothetical protein
MALNSINQTLVPFVFTLLGRQKEETPPGSSTTQSLAGSH